MNYQWIVLIFSWSKIVYRNDLKQFATANPKHHASKGSAWRLAKAGLHLISSLVLRSTWKHTYGSSGYLSKHSRLMSWMAWVRDEIHCEIHCHLRFWNIKVLTLARSSSMRAPVTCAGFRLGRGFCGCCESWLTPYCFPRNCRVKRMARVVAQVTICSTYITIYTFKTALSWTLECHSRHVMTCHSVPVHRFYQVRSASESLGKQVTLWIVKIDDVTCGLVILHQWPTLVSQKNIEMWALQALLWSRYKNSLRFW